MSLLKFFDLMVRYKRAAPGELLRIDTWKPEFWGLCHYIVDAHTLIASRRCESTLHGDQ